MVKMWRDECIKRKIPISEDFSITKVIYNTILKDTMFLGNGKPSYHKRMESKRTPNRYSFNREWYSMHLVFQVAFAYRSIAVRKQMDKEPRKVK